jgi:hypothetical protein
VSAATREDAIRDILASLISERRRLEHEAAAPDALAANRLAIAYWQQELARAGTDDAAA